MIRIGRRIYGKDGKYTDPSYDGFTNILCLTKSSPYGSIGPYELKDDSGKIMENIYQAHKIYKTIPKNVERYSRYNSTIIWQQDAETHMTDENKITPQYWKWRERLMKNKHPVRYPVGFNYRHKCVGSVYVNDDKTYEILNYIDARKKIYMPLYIQLVRNKPQFKELKKRLAQGENLLIIEVDGPHQESLEYYKEKYGVNDKFIENNTIVVDKKNMTIMLNDDKHPFGHGYCLGIALNNCI